MQYLLVRLLSPMTGRYCCYKGKIERQNNLENQTNFNIKQSLPSVMLAKK